ncbi:hypothetical protein BHE86_08730 [Shigella sp. FC1655]|nr:hypothetical protein BGK50_07240 [Shigella sp. FC130]OEI91503.1 hypothetical protein BHE86_08730 [Shigella sp. FC1655]
MFQIIGIGYVLHTQYINIIIISWGLLQIIRLKKSFTDAFILIVLQSKLDYLSKININFDYQILKGKERV